MIKAAKKAGVKFMVAESHAFIPSHALAKKMVDESQIGGFPCESPRNAVCAI